MGECFTPNYGNLFMGFWEEKFAYSSLNVYRGKIIWWGRYIDDVLLLWSGAETELLQFHSYLNSTDQDFNLKLSLDYSRSEIHFLDLKISKDEHGDLHISIFRKPTDLNTKLRADRFQPPWMIKIYPVVTFRD